MQAEPILIHIEALAATLILYYEGFYAFQIENHSDQQPLHLRILDCYLFMRLVEMQTSFPIRFDHLFACLHKVGCVVLWFLHK